MFNFFNKPTPETDIRDMGKETRKLISKLNLAPSPDFSEEENKLLTLKRELADVKKKRIQEAIEELEKLRADTWNQDKIDMIIKLINLGSS